MAAVLGPETQETRRGCCCELKMNRKGLATGRSMVLWPMRECVIECLIKLLVAGGKVRVFDSV